MNIAVSIISDVGLVRQNQEDNGIVLVQNLDGINPVSSGKYNIESALIVVADGMGGSMYGEVASKLTIESIQFDFNHKIVTKDNAYQFLTDSINMASLRIKEANSQNTDGAMDTTVVACLLVNDVAHIAWVGDSRCYRWNKSKGLIGLTKDHSYVQNLLEEHKISIEEAQNHPYKHIITKSLGADDASPDITIHGFHEGDILLLCSDGLNTMIDESMIHSILTKDIEIIEKTKSLVEFAKQAGGLDNITVALMEYIKEIPPTEESPTQLKSVNTLNSNDKVHSNFLSVKGLLPIGIILFILGLYFILKFNGDSQTLPYSSNENIAPDTSVYIEQILSKEEKEKLTQMQLDTQKIEKKDIEGQYYSIRIDTYNNKDEANGAMELFKNKTIKYEIDIVKNDENLFELMVNGFVTKTEALDFIKTIGMKEAIILYQGETDQE